MQENGSAQARARPIEHQQPLSGSISALCHVLLLKADAAERSLRRAMEECEAVEGMASELWSRLQHTAIE